MICISALLLNHRSNAGNICNPLQYRQYCIGRTNPKSHDIAPAIQNERTFSVNKSSNVGSIDRLKF
jgi:hypothetical protein